MLKSTPSLLTACSALLLAACSGTAPGTTTNDAANLVAAGPAPSANPAPLLERGRYLVRTAGCNDCHTPGYPERGGDVPEAEWLVGSPLGWSGPWGTTYAANLRLKAAEKSEAEWLTYTGELHTRPPMPDFNLRAMTAEDRRAIHHFLRSLGPAGQQAPDYLPPGKKPAAPYVQWVLPAPDAAGPAPG